MYHTQPSTCIIHNHLHVSYTVDNQNNHVHVSYTVDNPTNVLSLFFLSITNSYIMTGQCVGTSSINLKRMKDVTLILLPF